MTVAKMLRPKTIFMIVQYLGELTVITIAVLQNSY